MNSHEGPSYSLGNMVGGCIAFAPLSIYSCRHADLKSESTLKSADGGEGS